MGAGSDQRGARLAPGDGSHARPVRVSAIAPPALWLTLDRVFTGDWWWSSNIVDAYNERFHPPLLHLSHLPSAVIDRVGDVSTWPVAVLALASLAFGLKQRPLDAGVVFPLALVVALAVVVERGQISGDDVGRMLTALAVFAAAGAAVAPGRAQRRHAARLAGRRCGRGRAAGRSALARRRRPGRARPVATGASAADVVAPALEREAPAGYVALPRQWQGQLALSWDQPRGTSSRHARSVRSRTANAPSAR